jgi:hypothetical protein
MELDNEISMKFRLGTALFSEEPSSKRVKSSGGPQIDSTLFLELAWKELNGTWVVEFESFGFNLKKDTWGWLSHALADMFFLSVNIFTDVYL